MAARRAYFGGIFSFSSFDREFWEFSVIKRSKTFSARRGGKARLFRLSKPLEVSDRDIR